MNSIPSRSQTIGDALHSTTARTKKFIVKQPHIPDTDRTGTHGYVHFIDCHKGSQENVVFHLLFFRLGNEQQGLRLVLAPDFSPKLDSHSAGIGYRIIIRNLQDDVYSFDDGFDANLGVVSSVRLKMVEFERIDPEDGGNCAKESYLLQRFDPKIFMVTNETAYSKEVEAFE